MVEIKKKEQLTICLSDRLDASNAEAADTVVMEAVKDLDTDVLIDVSELKYISSAGLRIVLNIAKNTKAVGKEALLHGAKGEVKEIFRLSGFLTFLKEI